MYFLGGDDKIVGDSIVLQYIVNRVICRNIKEIQFAVPAHGMLDTTKGDPNFIR